MTPYVPKVDEDSGSSQIAHTVNDLIREWQGEKTQGALVITVEGERFSGKTTVIDEISQRNSGPKVRVRPPRGKKVKPGTCVLIGAKAFTQERNARELYGGFEGVVARATSDHSPDEFIDASVTSDFLKLVEDLHPEGETVFVLLDDFDCFDDFSRDLYAQAISLASQMNCVLVATATSAASLSVFAAAHRLQIEPMSAESVERYVEKIAGVTPPRAVSEQIEHLSDGTPAIVRETVLALSADQLTGSSHIPHSLTPGPLALAKAEDMLRDLSPGVIAALSVVADLGVITLPFLRLVAQFTGSSIQQLFSSECLTVSGGRARITCGVLERALTQISPPDMEKTVNWWRTDPAHSLTAFSETERMHLAMHLTGEESVDTETLVALAMNASERGGAQDARLLIDHAWHGLSSPDPELLQETELHIALQDGRYFDVLEKADAALRTLPSGAARLRAISARLDATHTLFEHSTIETAIEEYQRHRTDFPEPTLRHLLSSAERSFSLGLREEGLQLLDCAESLIDFASPDGRSEFELLCLWQRDSTGVVLLRDALEQWLSGNDSRSSRIPDRLLQSFAGADQRTARFVSRESAARPVSRSRRMMGLLVGAEADVHDRRFAAAIEQLNILDEYAAPSAFHPLRRAIARLAAVAYGNAPSSTDRAFTSTPIELAELLSTLGRLRAESPVLAGFGWLTIAVWYERAGRTDAANEALTNAWHVSRTIDDQRGPNVILSVVLPLALAIRLRRDGERDAQSPLARALRSRLALLDPNLDTREFVRVAAELSREGLLDPEARSLLRLLTQQPEPNSLAVGSHSTHRGAVPTANDVLALLTAREQEVAVRAVNGERNKEIGAQMFLSLRTVEATLTQIYRKLGVRSKLELSKVVRDPAAQRSAVSADSVAG